MKQVNKNKRYSFTCDIVHTYHDYNIWVYAESYEDAEKKLKEINLVNEVVFTEPTNTDFQYTCDNENGQSCLY